jgi:hypothetical protein
MADYPDFDALTDPAAFKPAPPQAFADGTRPPWLNPETAKTPTGISGDAADAMADATPTSGEDDAYQKSQQRIIDRIQSDTDKSDALQGKNEALEAERKKRLDPLYADYERKLNQPRPQLGQLQKAPPPPENPFIKGGGMEYMGIMSVFAGLAGALGRSNATTTMAAFGGAMKGYAEGNEEVFQQQTKEWEIANKKMLEDNQSKMDQYRAILEDQKMTMDQKREEIKLVAAQFQDEIMFNTQNMNHWEKSAQTYEHIFQVNEQIKDRSERMKLAIDAVNDRMEQRRAASEVSLLPVVQRRIAGDKAAFNGLNPNSKKLALDIYERVAGEQGIDGTKQAKIDQDYGGEVSYQRAGGTQAARVESASNEVAGLVPLAIESSKKLPRGKFVPLNQLIQGWQAGTSDPAYNEFLTNNFALTNAYARAMNPTGQPRVTERLEAKAEGLLSKATSQAAYEVQARQLWKEVQTSKGAVAQTRAGPTAPQPFPGDPKIGDRKQFKQGVGVWNGTTYVPETQ